jgi:CelD/BcsL family acetyltransferase involved in cellulose biosynthesis
MQTQIALEPLPRTAAEPFTMRMDRRSPGFTGILDAWRQLARAAPPLLAPELALLATRLMRRPEAILVGVRRGRTLVAALPLVHRGRTLHALRSDHTPRVDVVGDPAALPQLWHAARDAAPWHVLELRGVPADSPLATALPDLARADGCAVCVRETGRSPWMVPDGIEQRIHRRFRGDMRRLERQLGGVQLERVTAFDRAALRDFFRLEAAGWKGTAGTAIACDERLRAFYAGVARIFAARGQLSIAFLRARGRRVAAQLALEDATTYYLLKIGHDPEFDHYGPGQLLVRETAIDASRRGLVRYDLLGTDSAYKRKWTDEARTHVELRIYAPSLGGRANHFLRELARPAAGRARRALLRIGSGQPA